MSWTVNRIGMKARMQAMAAAKKAGMALGPWLDRAILHSPEARTAPSPPEGEREIPGVSHIHEALAELEKKLSAGPGPLSPFIEAAPPAPEAPDTDDEISLPEEDRRAEERRRENRRATERGDGDRRGEDRRDDDGLPEADRREEERRVEDRRDRHWEPPRSPRRHIMRLVIATGAGGMLLLAVGLLGWLSLKPATPPKWTPPPRVLDSAASPDRTPPRIEQPSPGQKPARGGDTADQPPPGANEKTLRVGAETGNPAYQYALGRAILGGRVKAKKPKEALGWIEAASNQGHAPAQMQLGLMYERGQGVTKELTQAFFWYQSAADLSHIDAQYRLGLLHAEGRGATKSHFLARQWFLKAAKQGHAEAMYNVGLGFELGLDTRKNVEKAIAWYRRAQQAGSKSARERLIPLVAARPDTATPTGASPSAPAAGLGRGEILEIQTLLKRLNFDPGRADGRIGARTREAIRLYQEFAGLPADGRPSPALLRHIREVAGAVKR